MQVVTFVCSFQHGRLFPENEIIMLLKVRRSIQVIASVF